MELVLALLGVVFCVAIPFLLLIYWNFEEPK